MRKLLRYLRTAFSIACVLMCLLLIALWVRSYYFSDSAFMRISQSTGYTFSSMQAQMTLRRETIETPGIGFYGNMAILDSVWATHPSGAFLRFPTSYGFNLRQMPDFIIFPYWAPVFLSVLLAAKSILIGRTPSRFSLRTLLIATKATAVLLALIVHEARKPIPPLTLTSPSTPTFSQAPLSAPAPAVPTSPPSPTQIIR